MCNLYSNKVAPDAIAAAFEQLGIPLQFPEGMPNIEPRGEIDTPGTSPHMAFAFLESGPFV